MRCLLAEGQQTSTKNKWRLEILFSAFNDEDTIVSNLLIKSWERNRGAPALLYSLNICLFNFVPEKFTNSRLCLLLDVSLAIIQSRLIVPTKGGRTSVTLHTHNDGFLHFKGSFEEKKKSIQCCYFCLLTWTFHSLLYFGLTCLIFFFLSRISFSC